jgi:CBS-domain-containing membrane protein
MVHRRIRRLPIVDENGVLVGIMSRKDLIRMLHDGEADRRNGNGPAGKRNKTGREKTGGGTHA